MTERDLYEFIPARYIQFARNSLARSWEALGIWVLCAEETTLNSGTHVFSARMYVSLLYIDTGLFYLEVGLFLQT